MRFFRAGAGAGRSSGTADEREWVGRFLGRIHAVGRSAPVSRTDAPQRRGAGPQGARFRARRATGCPIISPTKYADLTDELLEEVEAQARGWRGARLGRILGDCHRGNILWTDLGPHFVDLDDCVTGPAIQDLWMLLAGTRQEMRTQLTDLLKGYEQFLPFDRRELALIEPLRALRMIHYSAWLARRWYDPAFPKAFPWFAEPRYWEEHYRALEEQLAAVRGRAARVVINAGYLEDHRRHDEPESADMVRGGAAGRLPPRLEPRSAARARSAEAGAVGEGSRRAKTPQQLTADMVEAASQGKSQAPVVLKFDLLQRPTVGQPLQIVLALLPQIPAGTGRHRGGRLGQPAGGGRRQPHRNRLGRRPRRSTGTSITVTPTAEGMLLLSLKVSLKHDEMTDSREFAVPLIVAAAPAAAANQKPLDAHLGRRG